MCWLWRFCVVNGAGYPSRLWVFVWEFTICRAVQAKGHHLHGSTFGCHPGHGWQKVPSQTPSTQEAACDKHLGLHNLIFFGFPSLCRCQIHCCRCLPYSCHQSIVTKVRHFSKASKILFLHSFLILTNRKLNTSPKFWWGVNLGELSRFDWCKSSRGNLKSLCKPFYCHSHTPNSSSSNYLLLYRIGVQTSKTTRLCQVQSDDVSQCSKATPFAVRIRCGSFCVTQVFWLMMVLQCGKDNDECSGGACGARLSWRRSECIVTTSWGKSHWLSCAHQSNSRWRWKGLLRAHFSYFLPLFPMGHVEIICASLILFAGNEDCAQWIRVQWKPGKCTTGISSCIWWQPCADWEVCFSATPHWSAGDIDLNFLYLKLEFL